MYAIVSRFNFKLLIDVLYVLNNYMKYFKIAYLWRYYFSNSFNFLLQKVISYVLDFNIRKELFLKIFSFNMQSLYVFLIWNGIMMWRALTPYHSRNFKEGTFFKIIFYADFRKCISIILNLSLLETESNF